MNFSIWFLSNDNGLLYLVIKNVYLALIIRIALYFTTVPNRKLYTTEFSKLFCLVLTFLLPPSNNFQLSLPNFYRPIPNPYKIMAALQLILKSSIIPHALYLLYHILTKIVIINKAIAAIMSEFITKTTYNENKHLQRHAVYLMVNLELLLFFYLREYNLISIAPVMRFLE